MTDVQVLQGDCRDILPTLPSESVHCVVTSPPYFGLRDYNIEGQMGMEPTPDEYVAQMVGVFREVRRVLRNDGTAWLNLGDSFVGGGGYAPNAPSNVSGSKQSTSRGSIAGRVKPILDLKSKQLIGIPWRVAFALQSDGWWLRSDIVWNKPNPMPESVTDRPTKAHEYIFLLSKQATYFYDADAIREPSSYAAPRISGGTTHRSGRAKGERVDKQRGHSRRHAGFNDRWDAMTKEEQGEMGRNKRDVWTIATHPYPEAHFATFPEKLVEPCILAGCPVGGTVLDPFAGSGTVLRVARQNRRNSIGIELNPAYCELINRRVYGVQVTLPLEIPA